MRLLRSRLWQLAAVLAVGGSLTAALLATATRAAQPDSASKLLSQAMADAEDRGSFHQVLTSVYGNQRVSFDDDVGTQEGRQQIAMSDGMRAQVRVIGGDAYLTGNEVALVKYFGFKRTQAAAIGSRWVSLVPSEPFYKTVANDATATTALTDITPTGPVHLGRATDIGGQAVIGISGPLTGLSVGVTGSDTLYVTRTARPLPVRLVTQVDDPGHPVSIATVTMSDWGERVAVAPPTGAVPFAQVSALTREFSPFEIPGAFGYYTFSGPRGLPAAIGRPWGRACKPVVFWFARGVPRSVYDQAVEVIGAARAQGLDVAFEDRENRWDPRSLYYATGQTYKTAAFVYILTDDRKPQKLATGKPEHVEFGWDMKLDKNRVNEDLTQVQGRLWMRVVGGNPKLVRRSIRQLIAMTQGIAGTTLGTSGISDPASVDRFTPGDISAMMRMSGCAKPPVGG